MVICFHASCLIFTNYLHESKQEWIHSAPISVAIRTRLCSIENSLCNQRFLISKGIFHSVVRAKIRRRRSRLSSGCGVFITPCTAVTHTHTRARARSNTCLHTHIHTPHTHGDLGMYVDGRSMLDCVHGV